MPSPLSDTNEGLLLDYSTFGLPVAPIAQFKPAQAANIEASLRTLYLNQQDISADQTTTRLSALAQSSAAPNGGAILDAISPASGVVMLVPKDFGAYPGTDIPVVVTSDLGYVEVNAGKTGSFAIVHPLTDLASTTTPPVHEEKTNGAAATTEKKSSVVPWLLGGAAVVGVGLLVKRAMDKST